MFSHQLNITPVVCCSTHQEHFILCIDCTKYTRTYLPISVVENVETKSNETAKNESERGIPSLLEGNTKPTNLSSSLS